MADILYHILGWIILRIKYPKKSERDKILQDVYDGSYVTAGVEWPLKIVAASLLILLLVFVGAIFFRLLFFPAEM
ncbi:hypothetical protein [uncultured Winogradskyella sp.]|uniref:hypothetical protein n=1 Tax=Winogradskyella sp. 4-2091 TaxID=3381659 RepID=UPI00260FBB21|nr:hypothetical protein [uncultured Winogradskyella sp.]